jgi:hypothetical protein
VVTPTDKTVTLPRRVRQARGSLFISSNVLAAMNQWRSHPLRRHALFCEAPTPAVLIRIRDGLKALR